MLAAAAIALVLAAAPPSRTPTSGRVVVARHPVAAVKGSPVVTIAVGDCVRPAGAPKGTPADCAVLVQVQGRGKAARLEWTTRPGAIAQSAPGTFTIGDDPDGVMLLSSVPVTLGAGVGGVIITQQTGTDERSKRRHDVFVVQGGALVHAFTAAEPRGPSTSSSLSSLDVDADGNPELVLIQAQRPDDAEADRFALEVYGWRPDVRRVVALPSRRPTVQAALVGMFTSVTEARALQASPCLRDFLVVDHTSAALLQPGQFAVAALKATKRDAELALAAATACDVGLVGAVRAMSPGVDVDEPQ